MERPAPDNAINGADEARNAVHRALLRDWGTWGLLVIYWCSARSTWQAVACGNNAQNIVLHLHQVTGVEFPPFAQFNHTIHLHQSFTDHPTCFSSTGCNIFAFQQFVQLDEISGYRSR